jgi:hypothetical protein
LLPDSVSARDRLWMLYLLQRLGILISVISLSVGLDIFGKRRWAGTIRAETRRQIERDKRDTRQPYLDLKDDIDRLILEGDRLKLIAEEYLLRNC